MGTSWSQLVLIQSPVTHGVPRRSKQSAQITRIRCPPPDAKRPLRVSQIGDLVPDARGGVLSEEQCLKESRGTGTRCCAISKPVSWQKGGQRDQRRKRVAAAAVVRTSGFWTTAPPFAHAGRSFDVSRWKVGRIAQRANSCEDTRSTTESSNQSWEVPQICAWHTAHVLKWVCVGHNLAL